MVGMRRLGVCGFYSDNPLPSEHRRRCRTAKLTGLLIDDDGGHEDTRLRMCAVGSSTNSRITRRSRVYPMMMFWST